MDFFHRCDGDRLSPASYDIGMQTPFSKPRAAYVHVPFCVHRCGYCDFTVVAGKDHLIDDYLRALEIELGLLGELKEVDTLFLGGGTPTHLTPDQLRRLLTLLRSRLSLTPGGEFSVEANPADLSNDKLDVLREFGVNRISLGVQSFTTEHLELLERDHREPDIVDAVERVRTRFDNLALDLIFAVPGQTLEDWQQTITRATELTPSHISTYGLTYEKGTAFWTRREKGEFCGADESLEAAMYELAMDALPAAGFEQYELSNFARPGRESRHNTVYWLGLPYWGFGPGAASYVNGVRVTNHRSVTTWLQRTLTGESAAMVREELTAEERAREAIMLGLRRVCGIDRREFAERFEIDLDDLAGPTIGQFTASGMMEDADGVIRLTRRGRLLADSVASAFL